MKILHITESLGGGVTTAIRSYIRHSSQYDHYIIGFLRPGDATGEENIPEAKGIRIYERNFNSINGLLKYYNELNPDVVHLHSTYAGFWGRSLPFFPKNKIIYTPHGFAFLRNDSALLIFIYKIIERLLVKRSRYIAACSKDEFNQALSIGAKNKAIELVNVVDDLSEMRTDSNRDELGKPVVGMLGRACAQKGIDFFAAVSKNLKDKFKFVWIGGGDESSVEALRSSGVRVTGWMERSKALMEMKKLDAYMHTAKWDGFPMSVLEAAKFNIPIFLREMRVFDVEGLQTVASVQEMANLLTNSYNGHIFDYEFNLSMINKCHSSEELRRRLIEMYSKFNPEASR